MHDFDAIIIGAGHNGLICALYLARQGWRVAVFEGAQQVGGGIRSDVKTIPKFVHDRYATNFSMFANSLVFSEFGSELEDVGVRLLTIDRPFANVLNDRALRIFRDPHLTSQSLEQICPKDAERWLYLAELYRRIAPHIGGFYFTEMPSVAALSKSVKFMLSTKSKDFISISNPPYSPKVS